MIFDDWLTDKLCAFDFSFIDDDFMMFSELYFIVFDGFVEGVVLVASFFDVVYDLEEVDGDGEDLSCCL